MEWMICWNGTSIPEVVTQWLCFNHFIERDIMLCNWLHLNFCTITGQWSAEIIDKSTNACISLISAVFIPRILLQETRGDAYCSFNPCNTIQYLESYCHFISAHFLSWSSSMRRNIQYPRIVLNFVIKCITRDIWIFYELCLPKRLQYLNLGSNEIDNK